MHLPDAEGCFGVTAVLHAQGVGFTRELSKVFCDAHGGAALPQPLPAAPTAAPTPKGDSTSVSTTPGGPRACHRGCTATTGPGVPCPGGPQHLPWHWEELNPAWLWGFGSLGSEPKSEQPGLRWGQWQVQPLWTLSPWSPSPGRLCLPPAQPARGTGRAVWDAPALLSPKAQSYLSYTPALAGRAWQKATVFWSCIQDLPKPQSCFFLVLSCTEIPHRTQNLWLLLSLSRGRTSPHPPHPLPGQPRLAPQGVDLSPSELPVPGHLLLPQSHSARGCPHR